MNQNNTLYLKTIGGKLIQAPVTLRNGTAPLNTARIQEGRAIYSYCIPGYFTALDIDDFDEIMDGLPKAPKANLIELIPGMLSLEWIVVYKGRLTALFARLVTKYREPGQVRFYVATAHPKDQFDRDLGLRIAIKGFMSDPTRVLGLFADLGVIAPSVASTYMQVITGDFGAKIDLDKISKSLSQRMRYQIWRSKNLGKEKLKGLLAVAGQWMG